MQIPAAELQAQREQIVREHMRCEAEQNVQGTVETFAKPRYEVVATGEVYEGAAAVAGFLDETIKAFPDMHFELHAMHHTASAVIVEVTFVGTHRGFWRGVPPTQRVARYRMCNVFVFEEEKLVCERLYFDLLTVLRSLGIARAPDSVLGRISIALNHPIALASAFFRYAKSMAERPR